MAQSQVYALLSDTRGYLWMGTQGGGIGRFDGVNFKTFTVKDGLPSNYIFCIREDKMHNLWIGTSNGLCRYNGLVFKTYPLADAKSPVGVKDISFGTNDEIWLATDHGVLLYAKGKMINVSNEINHPRSFVNSVFADKNNNTWYGSSDGLYRITVANGAYTEIKFDKSKGFANNAITCVRQDKQGNLWVGTYGDGAYVYNGSGFSRIDRNQELYKQTVLDCYFDNKDNVWLATLNHGVAQYNTVSKNISWITETEGLSNNHVRCITQDESENYWFGTSGGGACNYFGKQFTMYDRSGGLCGNFIYSIFRDSKQRLWIGTSDKGVTCYDSSRYFCHGASGGFADVKVKAINEDNNGVVYFGTDGQGLFFTKDGIVFEPVKGLEKKFIRAIEKDRNGVLWIATAGSGLYKLNPGEPQTLRNFTTKEGLLHPRVTCLHSDKSGRLWYAVEIGGIGYIENDSARKITFTNNITLPASAVRCLAEDHSGYLWAGTAGEGIFGFPLYQGDYKLIQYDHNKGLTSSNIYLLTCDTLNNLFAGSETGLDYLQLDRQRKLLQIKHYGKGEGFTGIETCQNSVFKDRDGTTWFGTINGLAKYDPANLVKNRNEPVTSITDVKLFNVSVSNTVYKKFAGDWNIIGGLELPYDQNNLGFEFNGINFSNPEAVRYQWKLEGADRDWSPVTTQKSVNYSNLGAGDYRFMVKAFNEDGVWNKQPVSFTFHISPPFWKRWWFILLVVLSVAAIVFAVFRWRVNTIQQRAEETQKKLRLEKDVLELEQKALRLQMNPHFIFNALNSIQSQIGNDNEQMARYYLAKFSRLMRQILDNSRNTTITLDQEISTLENYLLIEKFCNGDRFDYTITVSETLERDYIHIPPMILQPFIENSIKHGLKHTENKKGLITVSFLDKENMLECSVTDNGIGRKKAGELNKTSKETYHQSTALLVTQERLDLIKEGQLFKNLEIIDLYDDAGNATGTRVIVRIPMT